MGLKFWNVCGHTLSGEAKTDALEKVVNELQDRVKFLEQKQDSTVLGIMKEASDLGMEPTHLEYDQFSVFQLEGHIVMHGMSPFRYPTHVPNRSHPITLEDLKRRISEKKAEKYDQCRKKGQCK